MDSEAAVLGLIAELYATSGALRQENTYLKQRVQELESKVGANNSGENKDQ